MLKRYAIVFIILIFLPLPASAYKITWHVVITGEESAGDILTETLEEGSPLVFRDNINLPLNKWECIGCQCTRK